MKKERNSNFELLRIFAMLMIVMHHYICHGGFVFDKGLTFNKVISECAYWGGKVGINLFVLITGYFMVKGTWKLSKVLVLYGEILFYSWLISIFFVLIRWEPISIPVVIASLCIFKFFENLDIKYNKNINYVASSTFAVYLIHDDELFRNNVWTRIFKGNTLLSSNYLVINIILTTLIVFIFAIIIDKARIMLQRPIFNYFNSNDYIAGLRGKIKCMYEKIADINL